MAMAMPKGRLAAMASVETRKESLIGVKLFWCQREHEVLVSEALVCEEVSVMAGLVPAIHVLIADRVIRGCPGLRRA